MNEAPTPIVPKHVVIIPDGNRRWAKSHNLPNIEGHRRGADRIKELIEAAQKADIKTMTIWGFSTENWSREESEKQYLFKLFMTMLKLIERQAKKHHIQVRHLGRKDRLPQNILDYIQAIEQETAKYQEHCLNIALDYGGRDEILRAMRKIIERGVNPADLTEQMVSDALDTRGQDDPDFIIRTSGEQRVSGALPWQATYAELYFSPLHLPDFGPQQFHEALLEFSQRQRRFGK